MRMILDCDTCVAAGTSACDDCVVGALLAGRAGPLRLRGAEMAAIRNLADAGLVAPLRMVPVRSPRPDAAAG